MLLQIAASAAREQRHGIVQFIAEIDPTAVSTCAQMPRSRAGMHRGARLHNELHQAIAAHSQSIVQDRVLSEIGNVHIVLQHKHAVRVGGSLSAWIRAAAYMLHNTAAAIGKPTFAQA